MPWPGNGLEWFRGFVTDGRLWPGVRFAAMRAESLLRYWTLHSPAGHIATCELVRTETGLEVRCGWTEQGAQARVADAAAIQAVAEALGLADAWKAAYLARGWVAPAGRDPKAN